MLALLQGSVLYLFSPTQSKLPTLKGEIILDGSSIEAKLDALLQPGRAFAVSATKRATDSGATHHRTFDLSATTAEAAAEWVAWLRACSSTSVSTPPADTLPVDAPEPRGSALEACSSGAMPISKASSGSSGHLDYAPHERSDESSSSTPQASGTLVGASAGRGCPSAGLSFVNAVHTGNLWKKGEYSLDSWKWRWFALLPTGSGAGTLRYFDHSPELPAAEQSFTLERATLKVHEPDLLLAWSLADGQVVRAVADSAPVMHAWATACKKCGVTVEAMHPIATRPAPTHLQKAPPHDVATKLPSRPPTFWMNEEGFQDI